MQTRAGCDKIECTMKEDKPTPKEKIRGKRLVALILAVSLGVGVIGGLFLMMFYPTAGAVIVLGYTPVCAVMLWLLLHNRNKK